MINQIIEQELKSEDKNNIAPTNITNETNEINKKINEPNVIGYLTIPDILLQDAPIAEGTSLEVLSNAIGHFESTNIYSGNVGLASHNSGGQGDYFKNLKDIQIGNFIFLKTEYGNKRYIVTFKQNISQDDFSYLKETKDNRITLITCVAGMKEQRLCVQALEYKD